MKDNFNNFIEKARSVHGYKYEYIEYKNMRSDIKLSLNGVIYSQDPNKHLMGRCPEKNTPKMTNDSFISKSKEVWGDRFEYKSEYNGSLKNILIVDRNTGIEYEQRANSHLNGVEPFKKMTTEDFINLSKIKYGDNYDYSLTNYIDYHKKLKIIFKKTGEIFEQSPSNHLHCGHRPERIKRRNNESFIKDAKVIHDNKYTYDKSEYKNSITKVIITCPIHGDFMQSPNGHLNGQGCPLCNESYGEKLIAKFLKKNNINFYRQKKFPNCRNILQLPFDFFVPSIGTCIEFDGIQHFQPIQHFGGISTYESLKINDKIKSDYCEENYINLIRIRYDEIDNIPKILYENLKTFIK